jgi:hypothetical protein
MNQPASVTPLRPTGENDVTAILGGISLHKVPTIPKDAAIKAHYGEGYVPEFWDGNLDKIRAVPIAPGPDGHAGVALETLLSAGELNLTANAMEHLCGASELSHKFPDRLLILAGTRYVFLRNCKEFVYAISTHNGVVGQVKFAAADRVQKNTFALVFKD